MAAIKRLLFTDSALSNLPLPAKDRKTTSYTDELLPCHILRVSYSGAKVFYVRKGSRGQRLLARIGRYGEISIEQSRAKAGEFIATIEQGCAPVKEINFRLRPRVLDNDQNPEPKWLPCKSAAKLAGVSAQVLKHWAAAGLVPGTRLAGTKTHWFFKETVAEALRSQVKSEASEKARREEENARRAQEEAEIKAARVVAFESAIVNFVPRDGKATLKDLIEAYLRRYAYKRCKTAAAIEAKISKHVKHLFAKELSEITFDDAEALHLQIGRCSPIQSNRVIQTLKAAWNKGIRWGMCNHPNPFALVEKFPEHTRTRRLSTGEVKRLFDFLQKSENKDLHDFVRLSLFTGVRRSNLLSMRWENLNLEDGLWIIPDTKNGTPQLVPLGQRELSIINSRKNDSPWVFPSKSKTGHVTWLYKSWRRAVAKAEIPDVRIHDLRRSLACAMADLNVSASIIQGAMNHKSIATTMKVYAIAGKQPELAARQLAQESWFGY